MFDLCQLGTICFVFCFSHNFRPGAQEKAWEEFDSDTAIPAYIYLYCMLELTRLRILYMYLRFLIFLPLLLHFIWEIQR